MFLQNILRASDKSAYVPVYHESHSQRKFIKFIIRWHTW